MERNVILIVGPTAVGKSRLAILLAEMVGGEIISADSRQIYKFMDIGTAKPSPQERVRVPHYFIDIKYPNEYYNAGEFGREGRAKIEEIFQRGKTPVVVGGSGLYIKSLVDGFFQGAVSDRETKKNLQKKADRFGLEKLYQYLLEVDETAAQKIHPHDRQRIIRALEVYEITGIPISQLHKEQKREINFTPKFFGLQRDKKELYHLIEKRVDQMLAAGLVAEVENLLAMGYSEDLNSMQTVGYQEIIDYLKGAKGLQEAVQAIKKNTRNYAKRQMTWFRKEKRIRWLNLNEQSDFEKIAATIVNAATP